MRICLQILRVNSIKNKKMLYEIILRIVGKVVHGAMICCNTLRRLFVHHCMDIMLCNVLYYYIVL